MLENEKKKRKVIVHGERPIKVSHPRQRQCYVVIENMKTTIEIDINTKKLEIFCLGKYENTTIKYTFGNAILPQLFCQPK